MRSSTAIVVVLLCSVSGIIRANAQSAPTSQSPELMQTLVLTNPHSIPKYRVNNVVSNMPEFQEAFSCKKGSRMVRANQCRVW